MRTLQFPAKQHLYHAFNSYFTENQKPTSRPKLPNLITPKASLPSPTPPNSREEAILQAKTCLQRALEKPLNSPSLTAKLRKIRQPRFRVEIPVIGDDSPAMISRLALDVFGDIPIKKKSPSARILILWSNPTFAEAAIKAFGIEASNQVLHKSISAGDARDFNNADMAVFLAPDPSQLALMETITQALNPKPVVVFNPKWGFDEEGEFEQQRGFVGSFDVIYSFVGLEVRGFVSRRKGVVFKCIRDSVSSSEKWAVLVEEGGKMEVVSSFKARPSIGEVETVLYNKMAVDSPITKSAKFLRDLVSNVTGNGAKVKSFS